MCDIFGEVGVVCWDVVVFGVVFDGVWDCEVLEGVLDGVFFELEDGLNVVVWGVDVGVVMGVEECFVGVGFLFVLVDVGDDVVDVVFFEGVVECDSF